MANGHCLKYTKCRHGDWRVLGVLSSVGPEDHKHPQSVPVFSGFFFGDTPSQIHLKDVEEELLGSSPQLREHKAGQKITLPMHVSESGGNEDPSRPPPKIEEK